MTDDRAQQIAICQTPRTDYIAQHIADQARFDKGEYQLKCAICGFWKWPDEHCRLFKSAVKAHQEKRGKPIE